MDSGTRIAMIEDSGADCMWHIHIVSEILIPAGDLPPIEPADEPADEPVDEPVDE